MASRAFIPADPVIALPPVLAFALGIPAAPRRTVEALIEGMIETLDLLDGPDDLEPDGDELDGALDAEDEFVQRSTGCGPGCPISDPDLGAEEPGEGEEADVSPPHVYSIEPDPATGRRRHLGRWGIDTLPHYLGKDASA